MQSCYAAMPPMPVGFGVPLPGFLHSRISEKMQMQDYFVVSTCAETHILYYIYSHQFGAPSSDVWYMPNYD